MKCYRFTEENDWEGETWHTFIDMTKKQHAQLKELIKDFEQYELSDKEYSANEVSVLVDNAEEGYFPSHSYAGELVSLPNKFTLEEDPFYRGGINGFCKYEENEELKGE